MMANPDPKKIEDPICEVCKKRVSSHTKEEANKCTRKLMNKVYGYDAGGIG